MLALSREAQMKPARVALMLLTVWSVVMPYRSSAQAPGGRFASAQLLENDRVRVQRVNVPVGYRDPVSVLQNDIVVIQTSPGEMEVVIGQNRTTGHVDPGQTWYVPKTVAHQFSNAGDKPYDTVIVLLK
jgi:hypothetical protein